MCPGFPGKDTQEQIYYQSGYRMPYVRAHGLYTNMAYAPTRNEILIWRAPLFSSSDRDPMVFGSRMKPFPKPFETGGLVVAWEAFKPVSL